MDGRIDGFLDSIQTKWGFSLPSLPEVDLQWEIQRKFFLEKWPTTLNNVESTVQEHLYKTVVEKPIIMRKGKRSLARAWLQSQESTLL